MTQKEEPASVHHISDSLLDGLQGGVVFFDPEGTVFRTNETARQELNTAGKIEGRKLTDAIAVNYRTKNILPQLIAGFDDPEYPEGRRAQGCPPEHQRREEGVFITARFAAGMRLFMFSFRNVVDEMTNESMVKSPQYDPYFSVVL